MPALIALSAAILGGIIAHLFTNRRDRLNKRREKKVEYLIEAYRCLESCAHRHYSKKDEIAEREFRAQFSKLESAIADIQLFGSVRQVSIAQEFARQFAKQQSASFDELLEDLRQDLRRELSLEAVPRGKVHLRWYQRH